MICSSKKTVVIISAHKRSLVNFRGDLIRLLKQQGCRVVVFAPQLEIADRFSSTLREIGAEMVPINCNRTGVSVSEDLAYAVALFRHIGQISPDVVLSYNIKPIIYGTLVAYIRRVHKRAVLLAGLGFGFSEENGSSRSLSKRMVRALMGVAIRVANSVISQNPDSIKTLRDAHMLKPSQEIHLVGGSGVNLDHFLQQPLPEEPCFLMLSRLLVSKGVREYAEAARIIRQGRPDVRFLLAGDVDTNPDAVSQSEVDRWMRDGVVEYFGRVDDVRPLFAQASVYVLPSAYPEGIPRSTLEALAVGRAIITTDMPGCREVVHHGKNGFLIQPRNVEALVTAMTQCIDGNADLDAMAVYSHELARERFDVRIVNQQMLIAMGLLNEGESDEDLE